MTKLHWKSPACISGWKYLCNNQSEVPSEITLANINQLYSTKLPWSRQMQHSTKFPWQPSICRTWCDYFGKNQLPQLSESHWKLSVCSTFEITLAKINLLHPPKLPWRSSIMNYLRATNEITLATINLQYQPKLPWQLSICTNKRNYLGNFKSLDSNDNNLPNTNLHQIRKYLSRHQSTL